METYGICVDGHLSGFSNTMMSCRGCNTYDLKMLVDTFFKNTKKRISVFETFKNKCYV